MVNENMLSPVNAGKKDKEGNDIYNLTLKTKVQKDGSVNVGLAVGDSIVIEKLFPGGYKTQYDWSIKAKYTEKDKEEVTASFFIKREDEYNAFESCGGIGDKVKITAVSIPYTFDGKANTRIGFTYELVN